MRFDELEHCVLVPLPSTSSFADKLVQNVPVRQSSSLSVKKAGTKCSSLSKFDSSLNILYQLVLLSTSSFANKLEHSIVEVVVKPLSALKFYQILPHFSFLHRTKVSKDTKDELLREVSTLDLFTKNLDPDLSFEVKQCWINPHKLSTACLLRHGKPSQLIK